MTSPAVAHFVAVEILAAVQNALLAAPVPVQVPDLAFVAPGDAIVWEGCCAGMLAVRLDRLFAANPFPYDATDVAKCCEGVMAAAYEVVLLRCAPTPGNDGIVPPAVATAAAQAGAIDAWLVESALVCLAKRWRSGVASGPGAEPYAQAMIGAVTPVGPQGGCMGVSATLTVELPGICGDCA